MSYQFENRYAMTEEMLQEYIQKSACRAFLNVCFLIFLLCCTVCLAAVFTGHNYLAALFGAFGYISLIAAIALPFLTARYFRNAPSAASPPGGEVIVRFGERISLNEAGGQLWFDYEQITKVRVFRNFSVLMMGRTDAVILSSNGFSKGTSSMFWKDLRQKRPKLKIKIVT